ncbi:hypothetical protein TSAR_013710 [Trichomalopsis sarcophagae]|uniref:Uncharacterized protein n=1 Tax=Trichomalopsis sarcophagae TaxID=543379 RepID=A0A232FL87_9HYME|nr:hypothetical protein TSAR_013710 [Trichomalopsis sarcophagae]
MSLRYCREAVRSKLKQFRRKLMFQAIRSGSILSVNVLVKIGCPIKSIGRCEDGFTVLHIAAKCQNSAVMSFLLDHGAEVNATEPVSGMSPLHLAVVNYRCDTNIIMSLLAHGSDVNAVDSNGNTAFHLAIMCYYCNSALIKLLLDYGADVSKENKFGKKPFHLYNEELNKRQPLGGINPKLLRLILPKDQSVNGMMSLLHEACIFHKANSIRELVRSGADVNAKDSNGYTSLYYAIVARGTSEDKESTVRTLLDFGADINQKLVIWLDSCTKRTTTVLHLTIMLSEHNIAKIFVEHAAKLVELRSGVEHWALSRRIRNLINSEDEALHKRIVNLINLEERALADLPPRMINAWIDDRSGYESCRSRCHRELRFMTRKKMRHSTVSFFDFLSANEQEVALYARNEKLAKVIEASKEKFPIYWGMLNANFERGLERLKLLESSAVLLSDVMKFDDPRHVAIEIILSYCSNEDLRTLASLSRHNVFI